MEIKSRHFSLLIAILFFGVSIISGKGEAPAKYHLIRLDDMGMCHSVNMAIKQVIETGIPVSTSVMFACPWYQEAVEILRQHPNVSVGIHLTLNAEWKNYRWGPVIGREAASSLVDENGYFLPARSLLFSRNPEVSQIEQELRAQVERATCSGLKIDYIDYHMGAAVETLELRELVENLAAEYGLGMVYYFGEKASSATYFPVFEAKLDSLLSNVNTLQPGINLQVVHVAQDTPEMRALVDLNTSGLKEMSKHRASELAAVISPQFRSALKANKIKSITYSDLIKMVGLENMQRPDLE